MFRTDFRHAAFWGAFFFATFSTQVHAQTIGDVANAQRVKIREEIQAAAASSKTGPDVKSASGAPGLTPLPTPIAVPSVTPPKSMAPEETQAAKPVKPPAPAKPVIVVHALYKRGDKHIAEITDGRTLQYALPGMRLGPYEIDRIDIEGIHMLLVAPCEQEKSSKKVCSPLRIVSVGGSL